MSIQENKDIARRFNLVWGNAGLDIIDELAAPELTVHYPIFPQVIRGPVSFKQLMTTFHVAFPDASITIDDEIAEDDKVVIRWTFSGTHKGRLMNIPPSSKQVRWTGITIYKIKNGKVIEEIGEEDFLGFLRQTGAVVG